VSVINLRRQVVTRTISTDPSPVQVLLGSSPLVITESGIVQSLRPSAANIDTPE
jgi:hypothetical protein